MTRPNERASQKHFGGTMGKLLQDAIINNLSKFDYGRCAVQWQAND